MDDHAFDALSRSLTRAATRRSGLRLVIATATDGMAGALGIAEIDAGHKRKKTR